MIEQNIEVEQDQSEHAIGINREQSVLHGIDGVSPIATVTQTATGATISITDRNGTTNADILNGEDGFSPIANVVKSGDTATITITDKNGTTTAQISDGSGEGITVDSVLSATSTNPVQNRVISSALKAKANSSDIPTTTSQLTNDSGYQTAAEIQSAISAATAGKQDTLTAGSNISISGNTISATDTTYTAGNGISIQNGVISLSLTSAESESF